MTSKRSEAELPCATLLPRPRAGRRPSTDLGEARGAAAREGASENLGTSTYAFAGQSGRPTTVSYPNGMQVLYDYYGATGDFLLKQIKNLSAGPTPTVISQFDYTYRADRSIDTWTVNQGSGATTWTFGYDGARQLTSAKRTSGSTVLEALTYGYDKAGNRIQSGTGTSAPKNYSTNNQNQLLSESDYGPTTFSGYVDEPSTVKVNGKPAKVTSTDGGAPYKFEGLVSLDAGANTVTVEAKDGQNNTATKSYSVSTTGTAKTFEYDATGNLRFEKQPNGTVIREYRWDQQNRLVKALLGTHESQYEYDGESKRVRIRELASGTQTKDETFVWCGSRICQKRSGSTVMRNYFEQGFEEGAADYVYTRDHLGSVREVVASNGTSIASRLGYSPWGEVTETGSGASSDFAFTGHHRDRPTGLALTRYRGLDGRIGRWVSRDPIGLRGGTNAYAYVNNATLNFIDPYGLDLFGGYGNDSFTKPRPSGPGWHRCRNRHNRCPRKAPKPKLTCGGTDDYWHQDGWGKGKWRSDSGNECAYGEDGNLLPDENANYTYNYGATDPWINPVHWLIDVIPHFLFGGNGGYEPGLTQDCE